MFCWHARVAIIVELGQKARLHCSALVQVLRDLKSQYGSRFHNVYHFDGRVPLFVCVFRVECPFNASFFFLLNICLSGSSYRACDSQWNVAPAGRNNFHRRQRSPEPELTRRRLRWCCKSAAVYCTRCFSSSRKSQMYLLSSAEPPPTLFSLSNTPVIAGLPGIVISILH